MASYYPGQAAPIPPNYPRNSQGYDTRLQGYDSRQYQRPPIGQPPTQAAGQAVYQQSYAQPYQQPVQHVQQHYSRQQQHVPPPPPQTQSIYAGPHASSQSIPSVQSVQLIAHAPPQQQYSPHGTLQRTPSGQPYTLQQQYSPHGTLHRVPSNQSLVQNPQQPYSLDRVPSQQQYSPHGTLQRSPSSQAIPQFQHPPSSYAGPHHNQQMYPEPSTRPITSIPQHAHSHSVGAIPYGNAHPPPMTSAYGTPGSSPGQPGGRPLPAPQRSGSMPPIQRVPLPPGRQSGQNPGIFPPPEPTNSYGIFKPSPQSGSPSSNPSPTSSSPTGSPRRPLPTPQSKHQSIDFSRVNSAFSQFNGSGGQQLRNGLKPVDRSPSPVKQGFPISQDVPTHRRASPPRFTSASNPPSPLKQEHSLPTAPAPPSEVVAPHTRYNADEVLPPLNDSKPQQSGNGMKFTPHWKRASLTGSTFVPPTQTEIIQSQRSKSAIVPPAVISSSPPKGDSRPLPPAPGRTTSPYVVKARKASLSGSEFHHGGAGHSHNGTSAHSRYDSEDEPDSDEDDMRSSSSNNPSSIDPSSSPEYGIRDLPVGPSRAMMFATAPAMDRQTHSLPQPLRGTNTASGSRSGFHSGKLPQPPSMSRYTTPATNDAGTVTSKFSDMSLQGGNSAFSRTNIRSQAQSQGSWPSNLPKLPRTPSNIGSQNAPNLDDEPPPASFSPVSFRRGAPQGHQRQESAPTRGVPQQSSQTQSQSQFNQNSNNQPYHQHPRPQKHVVSTVTNIESPAPLGGGDKTANIPKISFPDDDEDEDSGDDGHSNVASVGAPGIQIHVSVDEPPSPKVSNYQAPSINVSSDPEPAGISIMIGEESSDEPTESSSGRGLRKNPIPGPNARPPYRGPGLICGGCEGPIVGKVVAAMNIKWHPHCFKCVVCEELLEHVSSYEHDGWPYCHLCYHENYAPKCYHCKTAIIEERFISLDDPNLGKRAYHEQHFFCSECGDPFLDPSSASTRTGELSVSGDGVFLDDGVGFVVYRGYPYCEACHVRLRLPKCKKCKKSIRDHMEAVEALGGKWCWECFVCNRCNKPFDSPSFFQRDNQPYCEGCFSIMLRNEL